MTEKNDISGEGEIENMDVYKKIFGIDADSLPSANEASMRTNEFELLYNEKNPDTGLRYDIPMLKTTDPDYPRKYAEMMRTKKHDPALFDKIISWD